VLYDALAGVRRRLEDPEGELRVYEQKLAVIPGDAAALLRIAQIRDSMGDREGSIRALEVLVRAHPDHVNARLQLGFFYYKAGRLDDAVNEFEAVALENPKLYEVLIHEQRGNHAAAKEALRAVPSDADRFSEARALLARILEDEERFEEALVEARRAISANPEDTSLQVYLAGLLQRSGDLESGVRVMAQLIEADPENADLFYDMGVLYGEAGKEERAVEWMNRTLQADPDHASALNYIGYTWAEKGIRLDEAEQLIRRALEFKPEDAYITDSLGWVLYKRGLQGLAAGDVQSAPADLAQAVVELERAAQLSETEDPIITRHLADAYRSVSRLHDALASYRRALELGPDEDEAVDIQRQIELLELELEATTSGGRR
jgi:tetratricopeptide (TPR) repeat protein